MDDHDDFIDLLRLLQWTRPVLQSLEAAIRDAAEHLPIVDLDE
jgi:hypothetical protein